MTTRSGRVAIRCLCSATLLVALHGGIARADNEPWKPFQDKPDCIKALQWPVDMPKAILQNEHTGGWEKTALFLLSTTYAPLSALSTTTDCLDQGASLLVQRQREQRQFVALNAKALAQDIAQGGKEYLRALGALMGCPVERFPAYSELAAHHFDDIFPDARFDGFEIWQRLTATVRRHPGLAQHCAWIA